MGFEQINYLRWYMPRLGRSEDIDLNSSGVRSLPAKEIDVPAGDPWPMAQQFEASLARWLELEAEEVCYTSGATGGTLLALLTLVQPGEEILAESPLYEPMLRQAERLNPVRRFHRRLEEDWRLPLDQVRELISNKTGLVMITEPSNPSGTTCSREDILELAEMAGKQGAWLLVNEVYRAFSGHASYHRAAPNVLVVSSLSKLFGTYWARLGWLSASPEEIHRLHEAHLNWSMQARPSAAVGLGVMEQSDALLQRALERAEEGLALVRQWVEETPEVEWVPPQKAGFGCVRLPPHLSDDLRFAELLQEKYEVLTVPGCHFEVPGTLRLSWLQAGDRLAEGLQRLTQALRD